MRILVIGDGLLNISLKSVDGQIHLGKADRSRVLFQSVEGEFIHWVFVLMLNKTGTLDEHTSGTTGRVKHRAAFGPEDICNERDQ